MTYRYKITVEKVSSEETTDKQALSFEYDAHEDWFLVTEKLANHPDLEKEDAKPFAIGLKLFSGVMIKNRTKPLFSKFFPVFKTFMMNLKGK